jgi:DNA-binding LytR/AlgR family response regulator
MNKVQQSEAPSETPYEQELWISRGATIERVAVQDVERFEAAGDYVAVHCKEREYLLHDSLRSLVQRLDPDDFARVHRKSIVRLGAIDAINRGKFGALDLTMASGHRVPVSRPYRRDLQSRIMAGRPDGSGENASVGDLSAPIGEK